MNWNQFVEEEEIYKYSQEKGRIKLTRKKEKDGEPLMMPTVMNWKQ